MGKRTNDQLADDTFIGISEFDGHLYPASLEEAFEMALRAARDRGGNAEDTVFDVSIRVALRSDNQNVKTYAVTAKKTDQPIGGV
jgi:hypothetical protein